MAEAHPGYAVGDDARLRILLSIFEATKQGTSPSRAEIARRTGFAAGAIHHHIGLLNRTELLERSTGARNLRLTQAGLRALGHADLIEIVDQAPVWDFTAKGLRLLETKSRFEKTPPEAKE
jgi:SOS-response transcriptional repressor LexA